MYEYSFKFLHVILNQIPSSPMVSFIKSLFFLIRSTATIVNASNNTATKISPMVRPTARPVELVDEAIELIDETAELVDVAGFTVTVVIFMLSSQSNIS